MLRQRIDGLKRRWRCLKYGIVYFRARDYNIPNEIRVNGRFKKMSFDRKNQAAFNYEFTEICINDCYELSQLKRRMRNVTQIVDVGANQGLFSLAARQVFPRAVISCYEPNEHLKSILISNTVELDTHCYFEAVTKHSSKVKLQFKDNDLETVSVECAEGTITGRSLQDVIKRCGGHIDILKLDCEGAEWELLEATEAWESVRSITMEYHLWAKPGMTVEKLCNLIEGKGFTIIKVIPLSSTFGMLTAIKDGV